MLLPAFLALPSFAVALLLTLTLTAPNLTAARLQPFPASGVPAKLRARPVVKLAPGLGAVATHQTIFELAGVEEPVVTAKARTRVEWDARADDEADDGEGDEGGGMGEWAAEWGWAKVDEEGIEWGALVGEGGAEGDDEAEEEDW